MKISPVELDQHIREADKENKWSENAPLNGKIRKHCACYLSFVRKCYLLKYKWAGTGPYRETFVAVFLSDLGGIAWTMVHCFVLPVSKDELWYM